MLHVGWRFFFVLILINVAVKGIVNALTGRVLLSYMKLLNQEASAYQRIDALGASIWSCKGVLCALSDCAPLGGYDKRYYMVISTILGSTGLLLLFCLPVAFAQKSIWLVGFAVVLVCIEIATLEVMCVGKYSEIMIQKAEVKADLVSFSFACASFGNLIGCSLAGPIADSQGPRIVYLVALPFAVQPLLPLLLGFLPEKKRTWRWRVNKQMHSHKGILAMMLIITLSVSGIIAIMASGFLKAMTPYCLTLVVVLITSSFLCLPRKMAKYNVFIFIWGVFNVSISGALDFFYTASPICLPDGPNFSYTYYSTYTALIGTLAEWLGIYLYQEFLSGWTFRYVFWLTALIRTLASLFDYVMVRRLNLLIGIPDKIMYFLGDAVIQRLVITLNFLPALILTSKLCPRGMETTAYAVMDGMAHVGWNINKHIGAWAIELAGIKASGDATAPCNFESLGTLTLVAHVLLPALVVPLSFYMVPNVSISSDLAEREDEAKLTTVGSNRSIGARVCAETKESLPPLNEVARPSVDDSEVESTLELSAES